ncbi:MAG: hypothetical protein Q4F28_13755 [Eubacteriales bacterium]|nr:hypothetical protein [Eubacteriales bacterium]
MNGMKPEFLKGVNLPKSYFEAPDPYSSVSTGNTNLLELSRYARQTGKKLTELTSDEVRRFRT